MKSKAFTCLVTLLLALGLAAPNAQAADKPNILVIWGDDIGYWNVSAYNQGMMGYETPNIDSVAKEGNFSPTGTPSRVAPPGGRPSFSGSTRFAPGCSPSGCPDRTRGSATTW